MGAWLCVEFLKSATLLKRDEKGVTALEYGLIAALIAMAIIGALNSLAGGISTPLTTLSSQFSGAANGKTNSSAASAGK